VTERKIAMFDSAARETEMGMDGVTYRLRYGIDAISGFEEGTGILPAVEKIKPTVFNMACLLFAGLHAHHPEVAMETVKGWFNADNMDDLCVFVWQSFYKTIPEQKGAADGAPDPSKA
jgi:hypothetical protein